MDNNETPPGGDEFSPPPQIPSPQLAPPPQATAPIAQGSNTMAVISLVLGILALLLIFVMWIPVIGAFAAGAGVLMSTGGIVLAVMARKKSQMGVGGAGTATGGLIVSIIALVFALGGAACQATCISMMNSNQSRLNKLTPEERAEMLKRQEEMREQFNRDFNRAMDEQKKHEGDNAEPKNVEPKKEPDFKDPDLDKKPEPDEKKE